MQKPSAPPRIIIAITGATGAILGIRALEILQQANVETHLIISGPARLTICQETDWQIRDIENLANIVYQPEDISAPIASGSFPTAGMLILPCSIKTLSQVANAHAGQSHRPRCRCVPERRSPADPCRSRDSASRADIIRLMDLAAASGAIIAPPMPVFYHRPRTLEEMTDMIVHRLLLRLGISLPDTLQWTGLDT